MKTKYFYTVNWKQNNGFTLIELMIVVAIISILAVLSINTFRYFKNMAISAEAKYVLSNIYTLEQSYYAENETYGDLNEIGFQDEYKFRYTYSIVDPNPASFTAKAVLDNDYDNDSNLDTWTIDHHKNIMHAVLD